MTQHAAFIETSKRTAVFVDGDNLKADFAKLVLHHASQFGRVDTARVYTDHSHAPNWKDATGFRQVNSGCGKNATDLMLCIDAMALVLTEGVHSVVIATSDQDFKHLAHTLRERGIFVVGVGTKSAPDAFRDACHNFKTLNTTAAASSATKLDRQIRDVINNSSKPSKGLPIAKLNGPMRTNHEFIISSHEDKKWHTYLSKRSELYSVDPRGPNAHVRIKEIAFGAGS